MAYLGTPPQSGFITTAKQRVTSSTNNYVDLDHAISSIADVIVFVNFVKQDTTNLSLTTSTRITLGGTLVSSDIVEIHYLGKAVNTQTPGTGTVTNDMLAGSIANSKLANSSITLDGSAVSLGGSANIGYFNSTAFAVKMNGDQSVSHNTDAIVEFDTESYDLGSNFNTSTYKYTVPSAGYYLFTANLHIASDSDGLLKTSSMWMRFTASGGGNTDLILSAKDNESSRQRRMIHSCTYVRQCATGDTAYVYGYGNVASGGVTFLYSGNNFENMFQGYRVY